MSTDLSRVDTEFDVPAIGENWWDNKEKLELIQRSSQIFSKSTIVPKRYQNNLSSCIIALDMAARMKANPLMIMQNLYEVHGNPSWSAKLLIACFNQTGRYSPLSYRWIGERGKDTWGAVAYAKDLRTGEIIEGPEITIQLAKDEKWYDKPGSKWKTMPQKMLMYRAAAWMIDTHAPEIAMGLPTQEEMSDVFDGANGKHLGQVPVNRTAALMTSLGIEEPQQPPRTSLYSEGEEEES